MLNSCFALTITRYEHRSPRIYSIILTQDAQGGNGCLKIDPSRESTRKQISPRKQISVSHLCRIMNISVIKVAKKLCQVSFVDELHRYLVRVLSTCSQEVIRFRIPADPFLGSQFIEHNHCVEHLRICSDLVEHVQHAPKRRINIGLNLVHRWLRMRRSDWRDGRTGSQVRDTGCILCSMVYLSYPVPS
jgi:hypothetical protein